MNSTTIVDSVSMSRSKLQLFSLYEDFDAGIRAKQLTNRIKSQLDGSYEIEMGMWKIGSAKAIGRIHQLMAKEAVESDLLLVASSSVGQDQANVIRWLYSLLGWRSNPMLPGLLIGVLGDEDHPACEADWLVAQLTGFASRNDIEFTWRPGAEANSDAAWIDDLGQKLSAKTSR